MIAYEELAVALEDFAARTFGRTPTTRRAGTEAVAPADLGHSDEQVDAVDSSDVVDQVGLPGIDQETLSGTDGGDQAEEFSAAAAEAAPEALPPPPRAPRSDEPSQELDVGDVLEDSAY
jgi:hypothetical protein